MLKFDKLLEDNMTERGYKLWKALEERTPNIWERLSSSSKKYHKKENGKVDTIEEHTYEMVYACCKLFTLFGIEKKTKECDLLLLALVLHDSFKYGISDPLNTPHTKKDHDRIIGNTVKENSHVFMKYYSESEVLLLEEMVRFHSGKWSTDWVDGLTSFKRLDTKTFFIHLLDMLSTRNLIKIVDDGDKK